MIDWRTGIENAPFFFFWITHIDTAIRRLEVRVVRVPSRDTRVVIVHWVVLPNTFDHVRTDCGIMGVANDLATKQPSQWICKSISTRIEVKLRGELIKSLPRKVYWAKTLPYHREAWIGARFDPLSPAQVNHLKKCSSNIFILVPVFLILFTDVHNRIGYVKILCELRK